MNKVVMVTLLLAACAKSPSEPTAAASAAPGATPTGTLTPTTPAPAPVASSDPEAARWSKLAERLSAHDTEDLPDHDTLAAFPDAAEGLLWLATHDDALFVRARALDAIGVLGAPDAADVLAKALADGTQASSVRVAAVIGLGRLKGRDAAVTTLLGAVEDVDLRVAEQAVTLLPASARPALAAIAQKPTLAPEIRAKIAALP